jgi:hypothetical protein
MLLEEYFTFDVLDVSNELPISLCMLDATKPNRSGPVFARGHEEQLAVLVKAIVLWEIAHSALRPVVTAAAQDACARMFI